jgi:hypothetical protein
LDPEPAARPQHAGEVAAKLRSIMGFLEKTVRKNELEQATGKATESERRARRWAGKLVLGGVAGLLVGIVIAGSALWQASYRSTNLENSIALHKEWVAERSRDFLPLAIESLARDVNDGLFRQGWDRDGRERSIDRVRGIMHLQPDREQARGCLAIAAAVAAIPDDDAVRFWWSTAENRYPATAPGLAAVELACEAVTWKFPKPLDVTVLRQARERLLQASSGKTLPPAMYNRLKESIEATDRALKSP